MPTVQPLVTGSDYTYKFNDSGGVDYFRRGVPVTNTEYAGATGNDTNSLEQYARDQKAGYSTVGSVAGVQAPDRTLGSMQGPQVDPNQAMYDAIAQAMAKGASGASGSSTPNNQIVSLPNGKFYNLTNPAEADQYYADANADYYKQAGNQYETTSKNIKESLGNLDYNNQRALDDLVAKKKQLQADKENYFATLEKQGRDFVTGKVLSDSQRQNYFAGAGANAFQSSQATSQDFANNQFDIGLADLQKAGAENTNKFATQDTAFNNQQQDINRQYTQDYGSLQQSEADAKFARDNFINSNKSQLATGLAQFNADSGKKDYATKYKIDPYSSVNTYQPDLSGQNKFTNFSTSSPVNTPETTGYAFSGLSNGQMTPQENYFGYTPNSEDKNRISKYFKGQLAT